MNDETGTPRSELGVNVSDDLAPKSVRLELWIIDFRKAGADSHCIGLNALDAGHGYQRINAFFQGREKRDDFAGGSGQRREAAWRSAPPSEPFHENLIVRRSQVD